MKKPKPQGPVIHLDGPCCPHGASKPHIISPFMPNAHIKLADPKAGDYCPGPST